MSPINDRIATFYDATSELWERTWGEHLHHGFYGAGETIDNKLPQQAQIDLIERLLAWGGVAAPQAIADVGCGIGGSALYLARRYGASVTGITLSSVQAERARARSQAAGLAEQVTFAVADAQAMPFGDCSFELVWSLESGEHMTDKAAFLQECLRILKPGGLLLCATWCHREICDRPLLPDEIATLQRIYDLYCLPYVLALSDYAAIAYRVGFRRVRTTDWSRWVAPFWDAVWRSALLPSSLVGILQAGGEALRGAAAVRLMQRGYARGTIRFGVLAAIA